VELKAARALEPIHAAQCLNYLKATVLLLCLLLASATRASKSGASRTVSDGARSIRVHLRFHSCWLVRIRQIMTTFHKVPATGQGMPDIVGITHAASLTQSVWATVPSIYMLIYCIATVIPAAAKQPCQPCSMKSISSQNTPTGI
jgi:hypothetical protein